MMLCIAWDAPSREWWFSSSKWVILSRNQSFMSSESLLAHASRMPEEYADHPTVWTDDYASVFSILER
jgi:hypothetical protein